jgi:hypothetical protein
MLSRRGAETQRAEADIVIRELLQFPDFLLSRFL